MYYKLATLLVFHKVKKYKRFYKKNINDFTIVSLIYTLLVYRTAKGNK